MPLVAERSSALSIVPRLADCCDAVPSDSCWRRTAASANWLRELSRLPARNPPSKPAPGSKGRAFNVSDWLAYPGVDALATLFWTTVTARSYTLSAPAEERSEDSSDIFARSALPDPLGHQRYAPSGSCQRGQPFPAARRVSRS